MAVIFSLQSAATRAFPHLIKDGKLDAVVDAVHNAESGLVVANTFSAVSYTHLTLPTNREV